MVLEPPDGTESGSKETLRGMIRRVRFQPRAESGSETFSLPTQSIDVCFAWIVKEREVHKDETRKEKRRTLKCLRYWLRGLEIDLSSIRRRKGSLEFKTVAGESCKWLVKHHCDSTRRGTLKILLREFRERAGTKSA